MRAGNSGPGDRIHHATERLILESNKYVLYRVYFFFAKGNQKVPANEGDSGLLFLKFDLPMDI